MIAERQIACSGCGASFACGQGTGLGGGGCWCQEMPVLQSVRASADCLCPDCLRAALAAEQRTAAGKSS